MRYLRVLVIFFACVTIMSFSGCGGGGKDVNGSLTVTASSPSTASGVSSVTFTVTYTNPQKTDVLDVPVSYVTQLGGQTIDSASYYTNNSGSKTFTYPVTQSSSAQLLKLTATTGDFNSSAGVIIPGLGSLAVSQGNITFAPTAAIGTSVAVTISGGVQPYFVSLVPSTDTNISITPTSQTAFTVSKITSTTPGTATITVTDSDTPNNSITIPVTY